MAQVPPPTLKQCTASELQLMPALIQGHEQRGLMFFMEDDCPVVGAQCADCHCVVWVDARSDPILNERRPLGVPDHGPLYSRYYAENLRRFLAAMPSCPDCGAAHFDRFVNNLRWPRFRDGTLLPESGPCVVLAQAPASVWVWQVDPRHAAASGAL